MPACLLMALLLVCPAIACAAEKIHLRKRNQVMCKEERDVAELADTPGGKVARKLADHVFSPHISSCTYNVGMEQLTNVVEKRTRRGNAYVCFDVAATDVSFQHGPYCALPHAVTTLRASISERTGSYELTVQSESVAYADCKEGGLILLSRNKGKTWERSSSGVFPIPPTRQHVEFEEPLPDAIREACKGADYTP